MSWAKFLNSSTFLLYQLYALNSITLTDFTYCFYCSLLLSLDESTCLARKKHLHRGNMCSGFSVYTVIIKTDIGKKFMVIVFLTNHCAPDASHTHSVSNAVSVLSLALKLLG